MRIFFIRHGEPDYDNDCLTENGKMQALAVAHRLKDEELDEIYSSPMGRAAQTAAPTVKMLNLPVTTLDYMHEILWGGEGIPHQGHPWTLSEKMINEENFDFYGKDWREHPYYKGNLVVDYYDKIAERIDEFVKDQGYIHDKGRFLCTTNEDKNIAIFSHSGSGACAISHLLNLPFPYVTTVLPYEFTSVIILNFPVNTGEYIHPRLELFNDIHHIPKDNRGLVFQKNL